MVEAMPVKESGMGDTSVLFTQFCRETRTVLKIVNQWIYLFIFIL
jgi:hypothetical protein